MSSNTLNDFDIDEKKLQAVSEWAKDFAVSKGILKKDFNLVLQALT